MGHSSGEDPFVDTRLGLYARRTAGRAEAGGLE
jgi:hypothetical protein